MSKSELALLNIISLCDELIQGCRIGSPAELRDVMEAFADHGCNPSKIGKAIHEWYRAVQDEEDEESSRKWEEEQEMRLLFPWHAE